MGNQIKRLRKIICDALLTQGEGVMRPVIETVQKCIQNYLSPVLIIGESGAGKEYVAQIILTEGGTKRSDAVTSLNCAAFPDDTLHSELFGHTKNAFTGAGRDREGLLKSAKGGIFLDEIDKSSKTFQDSLLRYLRTGDIRKLGSDLPENVNPMPIVLATSESPESLFRERDIAWMSARIDQGKNTSLPDFIKTEATKAHEKKITELMQIKNSKLSQDFLNRVSENVVILPPLRERTEDFGIITSYLIKKFAKEHKKGIKTIGGDVLDFLVSYPWPENIAGLEGFLRHGVIDNHNGHVDLYGCIKYFHDKAVEVIKLTLSDGRIHNAQFANQYLGLTKCARKSNIVGPCGYVEILIQSIRSQRRELLQVQKFKIRRLGKVLANLLVWRDFSESLIPPTRVRKNQYERIDLERAVEYLDLLEELDTKKQIYHKLGFKSLRPFNNWLVNNFLDH